LGFYKREAITLRTSGDGVDFDPNAMRSYVGAQLDCARASSSDAPPPVKHCMNPASRPCASRSSIASAKEDARTFSASRRKKPRVALASEAGPLMRPVSGKAANVRVNPA